MAFALRFSYAKGDGQISLRASGRLVPLDDRRRQPISLASDRNTGLWVFPFGCEEQGSGPVEGTPFYCDGGSDD